MPTQETDGAAKPVDRSPHTSGRIRANGIQQHHLDWGGKGEVLLLLTGLGDDAHVYDDFAPKFTDRFRVVGLTRRGFGESDKPETGYDAATRVEDIRRFLDARKIEKVSLVGHSLAGDELTLFAGTYPQRVRKLVYLDAAYDRRDLGELMRTDPAVPPPWKRLLLEAQGSPDAAKVVVDPKEMPPPDVWKILVALIKASAAFRPEYRRVKAPALAFYALPEHHEAVTPAMDAATRRRLDAWHVAHALPYVRRNIARFRRETAPRGQVVAMQGATHYVFRGKTAAEVVRQTRAFLAK